MKLLIGIILSVLCIQVYAESNTVAEFRAKIDDKFTRFSAFYDATNNAMTNYRLAHVNEIVEIYYEIMKIFGYDIEYIRESRAYVNTVISDVLQLLGGQPNACLNSVLSRLLANSQTLGREKNNCAQRANRTMTYAINDIYYPTFRSIQDATSEIPLLTLEALARGNVFDDNDDIIDYLQSQYDVLVMQWLGTVSQLFRWETTRFDVEGNFYVEEMVDCATEAIYYYSNANTVLMFEAWDNCRPQ
jgi:hypothetical protein